MKNIIKTRTLFGAGLTALAFSSIFTSTAFAQTCATVPTCDELGYDLSETDCSGKKALKCPFDNTKFYCPDGRGSDTLSVGDILFSDMTTGPDPVSGKTPIGIVFDVTKRLAIALKTEQKLWMTDMFKDVDTLTNTNNSSVAIADWQGKSNTAKVVAYCNANGYSCPAFDYVSSYKTAGTKAGDWYLPAVGELNVISGYRGMLNIALPKVGGAMFPSSYHWSSSEESYSNAWQQRMSDSQISNGRKDQSSSYVRPVLAF